MNVIVDLKKISGSVDIIPSKSVAHRKIIAAALSGKEIPFVYGSKDIEATEKCVRSILSGEEKYYCGESGSTLRFLLPLVGALGREGTFVTEGRLGKRPINDLAEVLAKHGMKVRISEEGNIKVTGKLNSGSFDIRGDISSQYISGLLFALPLLEGDSTINITGKQESVSYIEMTLDVLRQSGIVVNDFYVKGNQKYLLKDLTVEGDWSNGAFWLCAGALSKNGLTVRGLNLNSLQGDKEILNILRNMGAEVDIKEEGIFVRGNELWGVEVDAADIPDLVPIVSLMATVAKGNTRIYNAGRLRLKESDRLSATCKVLNSLGAEVSISDKDELIIKGKNDLLKGNADPLDSFNDHRMAMMLSVASMACKGNIKIKRSEAVEKSYPDFYDVARAVNGSVDYMED